MFGFGKSKVAKELDLIIKSMQLAFENNYKDNATANLKKFEEMYLSAVEHGEMEEKEKVIYGKLLEDYKQRLRNFDHKKPAQW